MRRLPLALLLLLLVACEPAPLTPTAGPSAPIQTPTRGSLRQTPTTAAQPGPTMVTPGPMTATVTTPPAETIRELTILYTNDEHGWMEGVGDNQGAANLVGLWQEAEGYTPEGPFLVLSGGDLYTGPAISTWFDGQSMIEVLNGMGYAAAAVGNHEFDFGLAGLQERAAQAQFPLLSANIRNKANGLTPTELGIERYVVLERNGIRVGLTGLTTTSTPVTTNPVNVAGFDFLDYETALRQVVPEMVAAGAELILVPAHVCQEELEELASRIGDLGVHMLGGGHCNELLAEEINGIILIEGGYHLTSYARATFRFDTASDTMVEATADVFPNRGGPAEPTVAAIVGRWQDEAEVELNRPIGYTEAGVERRSPEMEQLITESWLLGYPTADVALTNLGGIRDAIRPGEITLADVVGVLPFNNVIVELSLTGSELDQVLSRADDFAIGGLRRAGVRWVLERSGEELEPDQSYTVLVNDFMFAGGDGLDLLAIFDPDGYNTAIDWRQPVISWIEAQASDATNPIDAAIADLAE
jgi:2',3'-cyclic-nucleotide 2'-phosphodiesterase (5'-nucleotidase family)